MTQGLLDAPRAFVNGEPKTLEKDPTKLWLALSELPRPYRVVDFPRLHPDTGKPVGQVAIWPLSQEEQMICNAEADKFARSLLKEAAKKDEHSFGYEHTYGNDSAIQILFRACRDPENLERAAFPSTQLMRRKLTTDEVSALFSMYLTVQAEVGPIIRSMNEDELEALVYRLEEGGSAFPFALLSLETQTRLVTFMASKLVSFWTATISHGLQQSDSSNEREQEPSPADDESTATEEPTTNE